MRKHETGTREQWLAARLELLEAEKELMRRSDEVARQRRQLPWVRLRRRLHCNIQTDAASRCDLTQVPALVPTPAPRP